MEDDAVLAIEALALAWSTVLDEVAASGASTTWATDDMKQFVDYLVGFPRAAKALQEWSLGKSNLMRADIVRGRTQ